MSKPFRFAVQSFNADSGKEWAERARRAEALGYSALHLADHLLGPGPALERTNHPPQNLAAVPAMAYAAAVTADLKIGCRVFCIDYRQPVVLLKEAMTIDLLSDGRLELGLGAGWLKDEYGAVGIPFDEPPRRIDRLDAVVQALKAFRSDGPMELHNDAVQWSEFEGLPKPAGDAPIMIGGGSPRILRLAGREANIVSLNFNNRAGVIGPDGVQTSSEDETQKKVGWVKAGAGDRFDDVELEIGAYFTVVTDKAEEAVAGFAAMFGLSPDEMKVHPHALFGSVDAICEELERRRELHGISYITVSDTNLEAFAPVVARLTGK